MIASVADVAKKYLRYTVVSGPDNIGGPCPFHKGGKERRPSFYINTKSGLWYCHSCHQKGTLVQFLQRMQAGAPMIDMILEQLRLTPPRDDHVERDPGLGEHFLNEGILGVFDYCPIDLVKEGFDKHLLKKMEIGFDTHEMRITFPIRDLYGNLVGISGRTVRNEHPRYKVYKAADILRYAPDDPQVIERYRKYEIKSHNFLWNMHNVFPEAFYGDLDKIIITEGYKACLWLIQNGWPYTVALQGSRMSRAQEMTLGCLKVVVFLFLDHDQAGLEGTVDTGMRLTARGMSVRVCEYPEGFEDEKVQPDNLSREVLTGVVDAALDFRKWRKKYGIQSTARPI